MITYGVRTKVFLNSRSAVKYATQLAQNLPTVPKPPVDTTVISLRSNTIKEFPYIMCVRELRAIYGTKYAPLGRDFFGLKNGIWVKGLVSEVTTTVVIDVRVSEEPCI